MNVFILKPKGGLPDNDNPWEPWFDKVFGFIIRANNEKEARELANANAMYEKDKEIPNPWIDEKYSIYEELKNEGPKELIMIDCRSA